MPVGGDRNDGSYNDGAVDGPLPNLDPYNGHKPEGTVANVQTGTGNHSLVAHQEQTTPQSPTSTSNPSPPVAVSQYNDPGIVVLHAGNPGLDNLLAHQSNPPAAADGVAIGDTMVLPTLPHSSGPLRARSVAFLGVHAPCKGAK